MAPNTKKLSLKPIEKALQEVLRGLERIGKRKDLTPAQRKTLAKDIKGVKKLIKEVSPICKAGPPAYDFNY